MSLLDKLDINLCNAFFSLSVTFYIVHSQPLQAVKKFRCATKAQLFLPNGMDISMRKHTYLDNDHFAVAVGEFELSVLAPPSGLMVVELDVEDN